ncbi:MAG: hypothetical protein WKG07_47350 [Hymenobacter sp.]
MAVVLTDLAQAGFSDYSGDAQFVFDERAAYSFPASKQPVRTASILVKRAMCR